MAFCDSKCTVWPGSNVTAVIKDGSELKRGDVCTAVVGSLKEYLLPAFETDGFTLGTMASTTLSNNTVRPSIMGSLRYLREKPSVLLVWETEGSAGGLRLMMILKHHEAFLRSMPSHIQHYLIPLYDPKTEGGVHIHTQPEWHCSQGRSPPMLVAYPLPPPPRGVKLRHKVKEDPYPQGSHFSLPEVVMDALQIEYRARVQKWQVLKLGQSPSQNQEAYQEMQVNTFRSPLIPQMPDTDN